MKSKYDSASLSLIKIPLGRYYRLLEIKLGTALLKKASKVVEKEKERRKFHLALGFFSPNFCLSLLSTELIKSIIHFQDKKHTWERVYVNWYLIISYNNLMKKLYPFILIQDFFLIFHILFISIQ